MQTIPLEIIVLIAGLLASAIGTFVLLLLGIIAYFLRNLLEEQKITRKELTSVLRAQALDEVRITGIQESLLTLHRQVADVMDKITDAIVRLTKLEERHKQAEP